VLNTSSLLVVAVVAPFTVVAVVLVALEQEQVYL
jgi:hypothetical protein